MDKNLLNIEKLFKSVLKDDEKMPAPRVWEAIESILDKENVVKTKKKYDDLKKVALLLFFMLMGISVYEFERQPSSGKFHNFLEKSMVVYNNSNGVKARDGNSIKSNKEVKPGSLKNRNKSVSLITLISDNQGGEDYKKIIFNNNLKQSQAIDYTHADIINNKVFKQQKGELEDRNIKNGYTSCSINSLYTGKVNLIDVDSINTISLSCPPSLTEVITGISNKDSSFKSSKIKSVSQSPFSLNFFFSPDFASYHLWGIDPDETAEFEKNERDKFSSTKGAVIEYRVNKHWSVQLGITYSNTNITVAPKTIYAQADNAGGIQYLFKTSSGYSYVLPSFSNNPNVGDSLFAFTSTHTLKYISLPFALKYYGFTTGKFSFNAMAGLSFNHLIKGKVETLFEDGTNYGMEVVSSLQGLRKFYFSGLAGVGIDFNLTKKVALTFFPIYRFALSSINTDATVKSYPNALGFTTGLKFNF